MCLLWLLLQFVVLAMFWDLAATEAAQGAVPMTDLKREEDEDEEDEDEPLMVSDAARVPAYRAVDCGQLETSPSCEMRALHEASSPATEAFHNASVSAGKPASFQAPMRDFFLAAIPILKYCMSSTDIKFCSACVCVTLAFVPMSHDAMICSVQHVDLFSPLYSCENAQIKKVSPTPWLLRSVGNVLSPPPKKVRESLLEQLNFMQGLSEVL